MIIITKNPYQDETGFKDEQDEVEARIISVIRQYTTDNKKLKILPCQYQDETGFKDEQDEVEARIISIIRQYITDNKKLKILEIP